MGRLGCPAQHDPAAEGGSQRGLRKSPVHGPVQLRLLTFAGPELHARQGPALQKLPEVFALQGRAVGQGQRQGRLRVASQGAQLAGRQLVMLGKAGIHAPGGAKTTEVGNLGRGQRTVLQPLFGLQQPLGLQVLEGRDLPVLFKYAPQVPIAHPQLGGQGGHGWGFAALPQGAVELAGRRLRQDGAGIRGRPPTLGRGQFRAAFQARPKARRLGLGGRFKETAIFLQRQAHPAHRAAVDARRAHAHEEQAVKAGVLVLKCTVTAALVERLTVREPFLGGVHVGHVSPKNRGHWSFSDLRFRACFGMSAWH